MNRKKSIVASVLVGDSCPLSILGREGNFLLIDCGAPDLWAFREKFDSLPFLIQSGGEVFRKVSYRFQGQEQTAYYVNNQN